MTISNFKHAALLFTFGLLQACSTTTLVPDLSKPEGATTFVRGTAEHLAQAKNEFKDPQAMAMQLHYSAELLRNRSAQIESADKQALARGVSGLLAQPVRFAASSTFSNVALQVNEETTARTLLRLGLDIAPWIASVDMVKGLAMGAEALAQADDCPRVLEALAANKRFIDADTDLRKMVAKAVVRVAGGAPGKPDVVWRDCILRLEQDYIPITALPWLWRQGDSNDYKIGLSTVTKDLLGDMLARQQSGLGPSERTVISELEEAVFQQARSSPWARKVLQAFFPVSFVQVEQAEPLTSPSVHTNMARRVRALEIARAILLVAPPATEPVMDLGGGYKTFNPAWVRGTLPSIPDIFTSDYVEGYAQLAAPTEDAAWLTTMLSLGRWGELAAYLQRVPLNTDMRWQAALVAGARQTGAGPSLYEKALEGLTPDRPTSSLSQGLTALTQARGLTPVTCTPKLYERVGSLLQGERLNAATDASLAVLQVCLSTAASDDNAAGRAMQAVVGSTYTQDHAAFRRLMQDLPLHWLLSPPIAAQAVTAKTEAMLWLRAPQAGRLTPAQQQQLLATLAKLSMSNESTQALPALRLLKRYGGVTPEMSAFADTLTTGAKGWLPTQQ